jgi:hypothetical protein
MDKKLKVWKGLSLALFLALMFSGYVMYKQDAAIQKQRAIIRLLWNDLREAVDLLNDCGLSKT